MIVLKIISEYLTIPSLRDPSTGQVMDARSSLNDEALTTQQEEFLAEWQLFFPIYA